MNDKPTDALQLTAIIGFMVLTLLFIAIQVIRSIKLKAYYSPSTMYMYLASLFICAVLILITLGKIPEHAVVAIVSVVAGVEVGKRLPKEQT
jgi:hypothetical protein